MSARRASAADAAALEELLLRLAQTPAPTGAEGARAAVIMRLWTEAGLQPRLDAVGNVVAAVEPTAPAAAHAHAPALAAVDGPQPGRVIVAAHLDSVFGPDIDVTVTRGEGVWRGPGIGDNAASLAILTRYLQTRDRPDRAARPPLLVAATVGEEGLGDLRGARHLVAEAGVGARAFVAFDGLLGTITDVAVGSRRYEARFAAEGGHSWGDYGASSAVHAAGAAIAALTGLDVPRAPRSSLNVGQVWGGTSVNAIAETAGFNLDLRSVGGAALEALDAAATAAIRSAAAAAGVRVRLDRVGDRPAGRTADEALVAAARAAYGSVGVAAQTSAGSTDANAAVAAGVPALAFGGYRGGGAHRLEEWLEPASLEVGLAALAALLARLA